MDDWIAPYDRVLRFDGGTLSNAGDDYPYATLRADVNTTQTSITEIERRICELGMMIAQLTEDNYILKERIEQFRYGFAQSMRDLFIKHMENGDMDITDEELMEIINIV